MAKTINECTDDHSVYEDLANNLERLKENRENIPEEVLNTKYKKSYQKLKDDIKEEGSKIFTHYALANFHFLEDDYEEVIRNIQNDCDNILAKQSKTIGDELGTYLFCDYSIDEVIIAGDKFHNLLLNGWYKDYWLSHCKKKNGRIHNDLIDMYWNDEYHTWEDKKAKSVMVGCPAPTKELYEAQLA